MRKTLVTVCAAALYLSAACQQQRAAPPAAGQSAQTAAVDIGDVAFGYTDSTGSRVLMLPQMNNLPISEARAKAMAWAVCSEGREFRTRYVEFHKRITPAGAGGAGTFADDDGHLSEIVQGQAAPNDTCMLVPAGYLQAFPISQNEFPTAGRDGRRDEYWRRRAEASIQKRPFDITPFQSLTQFAKQSVSRIEKEKGRITKVYWPLHRIGASQEVAVVEFNAMGDSLLGSLVLVEPTRLSFFDMPASLKKGREDGGCWRVDDDCEFHYAEMEVPAVLGEPGRQLVFFTFRGAEGQLILLLQSRDGKLVEVARNYRPSSTR